MTEGSWTSEPEGSEEQARRSRPLPRAEDLPTSGDGYDRAAVEGAFDAFYRHAAELDATLDVLEAVDAFQRQAGELRADIRALRAASWAPAHARQGLEGTYAPRPAPARGGPALDVLPRMAVEAAFIILVGVGAALAGLGPTGVILLVLAAWLVVALGEALAAAARPAPPPPRLAPSRLAAEQAVPEPAPTQIVAPDEVEAVAARPEPAAVEEPEPAEEPATPGEAEPAPEEQTAEPVGAAVVEEAPAPGDEEVEEAEVEDAAEPEEEAAAPKRGFWARLRGDHAEAPPPEAEAPRHVRVLEGLPADEPPADEASAAAPADPWTQGPEVSTEEDVLPEDIVAEEELGDEEDEEAGAGAVPLAQPEATEQDDAKAAVFEAAAEEPAEAAPAWSWRAGVVETPEDAAEPQPVAESAEEEPVAAEAEQPVPEAVEEAAGSGEAEQPAAEDAEPAAEESAAEPEEPKHPITAASEPEERKGWRFWRRRPEPVEPAAEEPGPEPVAPQHVRVIEVEHSVVPEDVEVPWDEQGDETDDALGWGVVEEPEPAGDRSASPVRGGAGEGDSGPASVRSVERAGSRSGRRGRR